MPLQTACREQSTLWGRIFLSADWHDLVMLNYEINPEVLAKYVPRGTQLDFFQGSTFISLVGFRFLRAKLFGAVPVPFHAIFEEVNLRFYVRRFDSNENRLGVVFIREIVPRHAVAHLARAIYGENYTCCPMRHAISTKAECKNVEYKWKFSGEWCGLRAQASGNPAQPREGTVEEFITEHYWGYTSRRGAGFEYRVSHVPWKVWPSVQSGFDGDGNALYGSEFGSVLRRRPDSAFIADGSSVLVFAGRRIPQ